MGSKGTTRVLEYARLAMGFANVRARTRVLMLVLVQAPGRRAPEEVCNVAHAKESLGWLPRADLSRFRE